MHQSIKLILLIGLCLVISGCRVNPDYLPAQSNDPIFLPTMTPEGPISTPARGEEILMQEDFSDPLSGWEVGDYSGGTVGYSEGSYLVTSVGNGTLMWGISGGDFRNVLIDVEAQQLDDSNAVQNAFGILCNVSGVGSAINGYGLVVSRAGLFSIMMLTNGAISSLVNWTPTGLTLTDTGVMNHIQVECSHGWLRLFFNGDLLAQTQDTTYTHGDIALMVVALDENPATVSFDNMVVSQE